MSHVTDIVNGRKAPRSAKHFGLSTAAKPWQKTTTDQESLCAHAASNSSATERPKVTMVRVTLTKMMVKSYLRLSGSLAWPAIFRELGGE